MQEKKHQSVRKNGRVSRKVSAEIKLLTYKFYPKQQIKEVYN